MKKMDKQTFWAGLVGIIALVAISCELTFGGVSTASVSAAIKDLMGIAIDVMVFIVAIKIATRKTEDEPIETKLGNALDKWRSENSNMIIRDEEYDKDKNYYTIKTKTCQARLFYEGYGRQNIRCRLLPHKLGVCKGLHRRRDHGRWRGNA
jgi:hypothetical protein